MNPIPEQISLVFAAGAALLAFLSTLGLHRMGRGQAALLAALLIGTFLGPSVLGRVAPDLHDDLRTVGLSEPPQTRDNQSEANAREWLERQRRPNGLVMSQNPDPSRIDDGSPPNRELVHWLVGGGCLVLIGIVCVRDGRTALADLPLGASLAIGCGGVGLLIARSGIEASDPISSTVLAGACAAAAGTRWGFFNAGRVRMNGAARVSTMIVTTVMIVVLADRMGFAESGVYLLATPLLASLLSTRNRRWLSTIRKWLASYVPAMIVSVSMVTIDLIENAHCLWIAALAWLTMSDLRALLAALILKSTGMNGLGAWLNSLQLLGTGLIPIALAGYALWVIGIPTEIACALFIAGSVAQVEGMTRASAGRLLCSVRRMNRE